MNIASIIAVSVVVIAVVAAVVFIIKNRNKGVCQGDCRYCNKCK